MRLTLTIHLATVCLSIIGFVVRGILRFRGSPLAERKWLKITPHVVDTVLLASALILVYQTQLYPTEQPWLVAKIVGLLAYIALGMIAFRFANTQRGRVAAWLSAIVVYLYIVAVAISKNPLPGW